jgi:hypothetical protein
LDEVAGRQFLQTLSRYDLHLQAKFAPMFGHRRSFLESRHGGAGQADGGCHLPRRSRSARAREAVPIAESQLWLDWVNVRGEPIVCTPEDAFRCFMGNELDVLVVGRCVLHKSKQDPRLSQDCSFAFEMD